LFHSSTESGRSSGADEVSISCVVYGRIRDREGIRWPDSISAITGLEGTPPGGRNAALNGAAWTLGLWVAAGALEQSVVEDALYAAAVRNGLVGDDGESQCSATIRSGLSAGLLQPSHIAGEGPQ